MVYVRVDQVIIWREGQVDGAVVDPGSWREGEGCGDADGGVLQTETGDGVETVVGISAFAYSGCLSYRINHVFERGGAGG